MRWGDGSLSLDRLTRACIQRSQQNYIRFHQFDWSVYRKEEAAILMPLVNIDGTAQILFTKRSEVLKRHSGQVCFPGGMVDRAETAEKAALREFREEVRVEPGSTEIRVIGSLGVYPNRPSKVRVRPFIGLISEPKDLHIGSPVEVESIFTATLDDLHGHIMQEVHPGWPLMPEYTVKGYRIWGMTAYILKDYLDALNKLSD